MNPNGGTSLKSRLCAGGDSLLGAFLGLPSPAMAEMLGLARFDFAILDTEHGVFDPIALENCVRAADAVSLPCLVRTARLDAALIQQALDAGATGVQVPQIENARQAADAVRYAHFPPLGERGFGSTTRAANYGFLPRTEVISSAKEDTLLSIQIESQAGVENLHEILQVHGIDVVFIGTSDLSLSLGYESPSHPKVQALVAEMIRSIVAAGKIAGIYLFDGAQLEQLKDVGARYFALSAGMLFKQSLIESTGRFAASNNKINAIREH
jgi:4-hydroxy-2-oxoheptanedioate aldolase